MTSDDDRARLEPAGEWRQQAGAAPAEPIPIESLPIPQRLQMIERALAGLGMALQNAASREGVTAAVKELTDKIEAVESRLQAFQSIVAESLSLGTRLDGIDRVMIGLETRMARLPSHDDIALVLDNTGQVRGAQTAIATELGVLGATLGRLLRYQWWQLVGVAFCGAGVMFAGAGLMMVALLARPG